MAGPCAECCRIDHRRPFLNPEGTQIAFTSSWNADTVTENLNPEWNSELFLYDIESRDLSQKTETTEGITVCSDFTRNIVLFTSSSADLLSNADQNVEIYGLDLRSGDLIQYTDSSSTQTIHWEGSCPRTWYTNDDYWTLANRHGDLSADEKWLVWSSRMNYDFNNADGNYDIFKKNLLTGEIAQQTETESGAEEHGMTVIWPRISGDGGRIADLFGWAITGKDIVIGGDHDHYPVFVFLLHFDYRFPGFGCDSDVTKVAYSTGFDPDKTNPEGNPEIYLETLLTGAPTQITSTPGSTINERPILSGDGKRLAFISNGDFTGENPDGSQEVFLYTAAEDLNLPGQFVQVTNLQETPAAPDERSHWMDWYHFDHEGNHLVMLTNADLTGTNPDENYEIFLATFQQATLSAGTQWFVE